VPPAKDPIGVALGALAAGATGGAGVVGLGLLLFRNRLASLLPIFLFAGVVAAAAIAWTLARPITDWWRRGVTAALAVFGAMMLAALTAPADILAGRTGLGALTLVLALASGVTTRYALRSRTRER
jgi:hypothetical protein